MKPEIIYTQKIKDSLNLVNQDIKICIICGCDKIESHEFGISCEDCGALLWRVKC